MFFISHRKSYPITPCPNHNIPASGEKENFELLPAFPYIINMIRTTTIAALLLLLGTATAPRHAYVRAAEFLPDGTLAVRLSDSGPSRHDIARVMQNPSVAAERILVDSQAIVRGLRQLEDLDTKSA